MDEEELKIVTAALLIFHKYFPGMKWEVEVGPAYVHPSDSTFRRPLIVNGKEIERLPTPVDPEP